MVHEMNKRQSSPTGSLFQNDAIPRLFGIIENDVGAYVFNTDQIPSHKEIL